MNYPNLTKEGIVNRTIFEHAVFSAAGSAFGSGLAIPFLKHSSAVGQSSTILRTICDSGAYGLAGASGVALAATLISKKLNLGGLGFGLETVEAFDDNCAFAALLSGLLMVLANTDSKQAQFSSVKSLSCAVASLSYFVELGVVAGRQEALNSLS